MLAFPHALEGQHLMLTFADIRKTASVKLLQVGNAYLHQKPATKSAAFTPKALEIFTRLSTEGDSTPRSILLMNIAERLAFSASFSCENPTLFRVLQTL